MATVFTSRNTPPADNPHNATQQRGRRLGVHILKARNFAAYRGTSADHLGHVAIYDFEGNKLAGPFDLEAADAWLDRAQLDRLSGGVRGGAS